MIDHFHPNFPPNLSITPNVGLSENKASSGGNDKDAFGVESQREAISRYGIAGRVWEGAYAMSTYVNTADGDILDFDPPFVDDLYYEPLGVIELGSGTGVVAANVAREIRHTRGLGGFVIPTDLPDVCPLLEHNLGTNTTSRDSEGNCSNSDIVFVRPLSWGNLDHAIAIASEFGFDRPFASRRLTHIICSDLVYFPELLGPLLRALIHLTSPPCISPSGLPVKIVISYKIRSLSKETPFWTAFGLWFSFQPVVARYRVRPLAGKTLVQNHVPSNLGDGSKQMRMRIRHSFLLRTVDPSRFYGMSRKVIKILWTARVLEIRE
ncbi:hypothetical protein JVU11DRAFT_3916 [Chiua virens]|nr:hypothetical protein JVU11DRAFT_3916 [Chiua virens]